MTLQVEQFRYGHDNLGYLVFGRSEALAVDGGAWREILDLTDSRRLRLLYVTHTHRHHDHLVGSEELLEQSGARLLGFQDLQDGSIIALDGEPVRVYRTPGHSIDSVCFHAGRYLLSGDTLFTGTIGNCFSGNLRAFYESILRLMSLPGDTVVFPGHDYRALAVAFARSLEPGNRDLDAYRDSHEPACVRSLLREELKVNPYLRFNDPGIVGILKKRGLPVDTEWERWQSIMAIEE